MKVTLCQHAGSGFSHSFLDIPAFPVQHYYTLEPPISIQGLSYTGALAFSELGIELPFTVSAEFNGHDFLPIALSHIKLKNKNTIALSPEGVVYSK